MHCPIAISALHVIIFGCIPALVHGCSRALENKHDIIVAGRSMDWFFSFEDYIFAFPRGMKIDGGLEDKSIAMEWTSKYGSIVSSIIGYPEAKGMGPGKECEGMEFERDGATDGINEKGLSVHLLALVATSYPNAADSSEKNALTYARWVRFLLDNFTTVEEAVEGMKKVRILGMNFCGHILGLHMAVEDYTGDSAIFEVIGGEMQIYHSRKDTIVMTNDPSFDQQKEILAMYEPWGGNISLPDNLPGSVDPADRFVRLEYYLPYLPEPKDAAEAIAHMHSLISSTSVPFGAPNNEGEVFPTWWTSFIDLTNGVYYFNWLKTPNTIWVDLKSFDFSEGNPVLKLKPQNAELVGDVTCDFETLDGKRGAQNACIADGTNKSNAMLAGVHIAVVAYVAIAGIISFF